ncbi:MAG: glycoside hydrolase family 140 protein [Thermoguttaceae bacterium]
MSALVAIVSIFVPLALAQAAEPKSLPRLRVSNNHRFLVTQKGKPFFYLADTAWELFHRLNQEEAEKYLADRADKGFNVIQAVVLAEQAGLTEPNAYGHLPLVDKTDPTRPAINDGPDSDYWDHVDNLIDLAAQKGLYIGLLPTWGKYVTSHWANGIVDGIFNPVNAQQYGEFIGKRYKDRTNIIWIIGGDRAAPTKESKAIWRAMAKGIAIGVSGREDYDSVLMTYHTSGPGHASDFFHEDPWLDFTSIQSSHGDRILNWKMIERDYNRSPAKPVIDLETTYPDALIIQGMKPGNDDHARRSAYWSIFAGACGHTYGHNSIWQMYAPGRKSILNPKSYWYDAIQATSASQMGYLRRLIESRPFLGRVPDQSLLACDPGEDIDHLRATWGDGYAMIYSPNGRSFRIHLDRLPGRTIRASWFDPRTGSSRLLDEFTKQGDREFDPPGEPAVGNDWVLLLDDADRSLAPGGLSDKRDFAPQRGNVPRRRRRPG